MAALRHARRQRRGPPPGLQRQGSSVTQFLPDTIPTTGHQVSLSVELRPEISLLLWLDVGNNISLRSVPS